MTDKDPSGQSPLMLRKKHITHLWGKKLQMVLNDFSQAKPGFKIRVVKK